MLKVTRRSWRPPGGGRISARQGVADGGGGGHILDDEAENERRVEAIASRMMSPASANRALAGVGVGRVREGRAPMRAGPAGDGAKWRLTVSPAPCHQSAPVVARSWARAASAPSQSAPGGEAVGQFKHCGPHGRVEDRGAAAQRCSVMPVRAVHGPAVAQAVRAFRAA